MIAGTKCYCARADTYHFFLTGVSNRRGFEAPFLFHRAGKLEILKQDRKTGGF
ncbi:hypothetical protein OBV_34910 [Oscillibacter valericigenes Sjm18-20]|nr:hypothetical protein OBV_34910 [Oscillibacter valericigenes Sjm18-20]